MKMIPLGGKKGIGKFTMVDDSDFDELSKYKWHIHGNYVGRCVYEVGRKSPLVIYMHRHILDATKGLEVDHIDLDKFNNQRYNLRLCTSSENHFNVGKSKSNTSGVVGVGCRSDRPNGYYAYIGYCGKQYHLGHYRTLEEAVAVRQFKAKELHGEFVRP